jgi:UTP--glucose-1-phosphate uridylyltransferase
MIWGDDIVDAAVPCIRQLVEVYEQFGGAVTAVMEVADADVSKYGIVDPEPITDRLSRVRGFVEKPPLASAPSNLAQVHAWILPPRIFDILEHTAPGKDGEIWLADAIDQLISEEPVYAYRFEGRRYDAGNKLELLQANIDFALRRPDLAPGLRAYMKSVLSRAASRT